MHLPACGSAAQNPEGKTVFTVLALFGGVAMPRLLNRNPKYRKHRASGQAVVTINGKDCYLGPPGSKASRGEYDRLIGEWLAGGRRLAASTTDLTISELLERFLTHAEAHYRHPDGTPTTELRNLADAMGPVERLYGAKPVTGFGPLALRAVRDEMIRRGWCRKHINRAIGRVKHIFKWAVGRELAPASIHHALAAVEGLQAGRTDAVESAPVRPVAISHVEQVLPHVPRQIAAMIQLQLLTAMRPGEVCSMRGCDIDTTAKLWAYRPARHKTQHHGHERTVYLGERCQRIIEPFLQSDLSSALFSPADAERERREAIHARRKTPTSCGNIVGSNRQHRPARKPGERYSPMAYAKCVYFGCAKAFPAPDHLARIKVKGRKGRAMRWETRQEWQARLGPERWAELQEWNRAHAFHPHQLRHTAATLLRKQHGLEGAQVLLGHKSLAVSQVYAEANAERAQEIAAAVG